MALTETSPQVVSDCFTTTRSKKKAVFPPINFPLDSLPLSYFCGPERVPVETWQRVMLQWEHGS